MGGEVPSPDRAELQGWLANLATEDPLEPGDPRYVDLEAFVAPGGSGPVQLRGRNVLDALFDRIDLFGGADGSTQLLSGYIGTGKSTELRRLKKRLEDVGFVVLLANARSYHDLSHPLDLASLVVILAAAFGEAYAEWAGDEAPGQGFWNELLELMKKEVVLDGFSLPIGVGDLKVGVKHHQTFWARMRERLETKPETLRRHAHDYISRCIGRVRGKQPDNRGVVFIFDQLERLRGTEQHFVQVMNSVVDVFTGYPDFLRLPGCHVIYTVPPFALLQSTQLDRIYDTQLTVLPAVKVVVPGNSEQPFTPGIQAMLRIVEKRVPVDRLFGADRDLLTELVLKSGGDIRQALVLVRDLIIAAARTGFPVSRAQVEDVLRKQQAVLVQTIRADAILLLREIHNKRDLLWARSDQLAMVARYLDNHIIVCFQNGSPWYQLHPLVSQVVEAAARDLEARAAGGADRAG